MGDKSDVDVRRVQDVIVPLVHEIQGFQSDDGAVVAARRRDAAGVLDAVVKEVAALSLASETWLAAFEADVDRWLSEDLGRPCFTATRDAVVAPPDGDVGLFVAPAHMPNSDSRWPLLQAVVVRRKEPAASALLQDAYPHPKNSCQSTQVLAGTRQATGGDCVVLFPENVPADVPVVRQNFAWFFFNKHVNIYRRTLALVAERCGTRVFADGRRLWSAGLDDDETYEARCIWGYLHDYFHHHGPRPFDLHLAQKTQWHCGLLEELKVDAQTAIACASDERIPFRWAIFEYVLFERLFRYPRAGDAALNADAGSGVLLGSWLVGHAAAEQRDSHVLLARPEVLTQAMSALVAQIEALEALDDDRYSAAAEGFVGSLLGAPRHEGERYGVPDTYARVFLGEGGLCRV